MSPRHYANNTTSAVISNAIVDGIAQKFKLPAFITISVMFTFIYYILNYGYHFNIWVPIIVIVIFYYLIYHNVK